MSLLDEARPDDLELVGGALGGGALISHVPAKNTYGLTCTRLGHDFHTSSRSSIMTTISSPQGNTDLQRKNVSTGFKYKYMYM